MTVFGADVSAFQEGADLRKLKAQGYDFVMLKCTEGHTVKDSAYPTFLQQAADAKLLTLAYHFLHSDSSPLSQAQNLASHIGDKHIPVMIDLEPTGSSEPTLEHVFAFTQACVALGLTVDVLYQPTWYWSKLGRPNLPRSYDLVASLYGRNSYAYGSQLYAAAGGDKGAGWAPYGGVRPTFWQFGSDDRVDGVTTPGRGVDVDAYRGTLAQLRGTGLFHDWSPPPTPPAPKPPAPVPPAPKPPAPPNPEKPVGKRTLTDADVAALLDARIPIGAGDKLAGHYGSDSYTLAEFVRGADVHAREAISVAQANAARLDAIAARLDALAPHIPTETA